MIFYFSGTGNSQFAAHQIARYTGDEIVSINHYLKSGKSGYFKSQTPLVFVVPTYAWRIPKVVEIWIRQATFQGSKKAYFVLTCGSSVGDAQGYAKKLCSDKGLLFQGLSSLIMPENYLALFPTPEASQCQALLKNAVPSLHRLAGFIQKEHPFPEKKGSLGAKVASGPINTLFYPIFVKDKGFRAGQDCISCYQCVKNCPLNNVELVSGKPVWKGHCTHCMACISCCPTKTIEYKNSSIGRHRHFIMKKEGVDEPIV